MYRIKALNETSEEAGPDDHLRPKEACQEILEDEALKRYKEGLIFQKNQQWNFAKDVFKEVLAYPVIMKAEPVENPSKTTEKGLSSIYGKTALSIKYACYKNLAEIHKTLKEYETALDYYSEALELDGTDVTVWYRCGIIASKIGDIQLASHAFIQGVQCSNENWPCLDRACISLYVEGNYTKCLEYISRCFGIDSNFSRGLILRDLILLEQPSLEKDILYLNPSVKLLCDKKFDGPDNIKEILLEEIKVLRQNRTTLKNQHRKEEVRVVLLRHPLEKLSWVDLGESLIALRIWMLDREDPISLLTPVNLLEGASEMKATEPTPATLEKIELKEIVREEPVAEISDEEKQEECVGEEKEKKGKRRSGSALMEELLWSGKRRSARVRSSRKEHESWSVADALRTILPRKLLNHMKTITREASKIINEDSMDTMDLYKLFEKQDGGQEEKETASIRRCNVEVDRDKIVADEGYFSTLQEESDVRVFIETSNMKGLFEIVKLYVSRMEKLWIKTWPKKLLPLFIECYNAVRTSDPLLWMKLVDHKVRDQIADEGHIALLYLELRFDADSRLNDQDLNANIYGLQEMSSDVSLFSSPDAHGVFLIRFLWLISHIYLEQGNTSLAITYLNGAIDSYEKLPSLENKTIHLPNCRRNYDINKCIVQATLGALSRKKSLTEVVRLYENGSYEELKNILIETFNAPAKSVKNQENEFIDKQTQLAMLVNALHHLDSYKECVYWLELSCYECFRRANINNKNDEEEENQTWEVEFDRLLVAIDECCEQGQFKITDALPLSRLSRLVQTLCCVICRQTEGIERPPCASRPWAMLNRILVALEHTELLENPAKDGVEIDLPPSVLVLFTAHQYLGKREWCNCDGNVLLFLILDQVIPRIRLPQWACFRETVQQYLEQVVFCLYAHPNKRTRPRYVADHNVSPIEMTWERAMQIFEIFRPDEVPTFDSLRWNTATDTEALFRKIAALIPSSIDPSQGTTEMEEFIYGKTPKVPVPKVKLPSQVRDLFYIIGDLYMKNHDSTKAIKFLLLDLCANPDRVDAWASMALVRVSLLEYKLNICEPFKNEEFLKEAMAAIRCFEYLFKLDSTICPLWIEYGTFCYTVHSFCSQRMKLESDSLSLDHFEELETTKTKMLELAKNAFVTVNNVWNNSTEVDRQDERWLHHYMLGKICEKHGDLAYFDHFVKASQLLYDNNAQYPKKISYNAPPTYAIESMEIYYRIHVCVIKSLELLDGEQLDEKTRDCFVEALKIAAKSPFASLKSKSDLIRQKAKEEEEREAKIKKRMDIVRSVLDKVIKKVELTLENEAISETAMNMEKESKEENNTTDVCVGEKDNLMDVTALTAVGEIKDDSNNADEHSDKEVDEVENEAVTKVDTEGEETPQKFFESMIDDVALDNKGDEDEAAMDYEEAAKAYEATEFAPTAFIAPNELLEADSLKMDPYFEPYPHEQLPEDNYYLTIDDFKNVAPPTNTVPISNKKRPRQRSASPASSVSSVAGSIKYDDDSSSSSSISYVTSRSQTKSPPSPPPSSDSEDAVGEHKKGTEKVDKSSIEKDKKVETEILKHKDAAEVEKVEQIVEEKPATPDEVDSEEKMLKQCLHAFETCAIRFPQHYKSIYRLAHFFYRSKQHKDLNKCRDLLLGSYSTSQGAIGGLFSEKKNTNFFNGIWRLPSGDIDRAGCFSSHMSRSILLLLEVLRDLRDYKLLYELSLQLRKVPEQDKRYLREDERKQLSKQALTLSLQTLRNIIRSAESITVTQVLDIYKVYRKAQRHTPAKESMFVECLMDAFTRLGNGGRFTLDQCLKFCKGEITGNKIPPPWLNTVETVGKPKLKKMRKENSKEEETASLKATQVKTLKQPKPLPSKEIKKIPAISSDSAVLESVPSTRLPTPPKEVKPLSSAVTKITVPPPMSLTPPPSVTVTPLPITTAVPPVSSVITTSISSSSTSAVEAMKKIERTPTVSASTRPSKIEETVEHSSISKGKKIDQPSKHNSSVTAELSSEHSIVQKPIIKPSQASHHVPVPAITVQPLPNPKPPVKQQSYPIPLTSSDGSKMYQQQPPPAHSGSSMPSSAQNKSHPKTQTLPPVPYPMVQHQHQQQPYFAYSMDINSEAMYREYAYLQYLDQMQKKSMKPRKSRPPIPPAHSTSHLTASVPSLTSASSSLSVTPISSASQKTSYNKPPLSSSSGSSLSVTPVTSVPQKTFSSLYSSSSSMHAPSLSVNPMPSSQRIPQHAHKAHVTPPPKSLVPPTLPNKPPPLPPCLVIKPVPRAPSPPRSVIQSPPESKSKFSIDAILGKNPGLTIVSPGKNPSSSNTAQAEAINLSPNRGIDNPTLKRDSGEQSQRPIKKPCLDVEVVTLDD